MMNTTDRRLSRTATDVQRVYRTVVEEARAADEPSPDIPDGIDAGDMAERLQLPLSLWESGRKPSRARAGLLATDHHLAPAERAAVEPMLVGLDVLVAMLDESLDTPASTDRDRLDLAVNVAFGSLLAFGHIPAKLTEPVVERLQRYFLTVARIPLVERGVWDRLSTVERPDAGMDLVQSCYAYRAHDIDAFGRIPALVAGLDGDATARLVSDLRTYRARYLLFDDVRDVRDDIGHGTETPVVWLLRVCDSPEAVERRLFEVYRTFEYADPDRRLVLGSLEREPPSLGADIAALYDTV